MSETISPNTALAHHPIVCKIGEGGMGEVFWERDEKLNREVAIKVLPADMSYDEEHLMQFKGERQILASLNHPNIPAIYGVKDSDQVVALLMELVHTEAINEGRKAHLRELLNRIGFPQ